MRERGGGPKDEGKGLGLGTGRRMQERRSGTWTVDSWGQGGRRCGTVDRFKSTIKYFLFIFDHLWLSRY